MQENKKGTDSQRKPLIIEARKYNSLSEDYFDKTKQKKQTKEVIQLSFPDLASFLCL